MDREQFKRNLEATYGLQNLGSPEYLISVLVENNASELAKIRKRKRELDLKMESALAAWDAAESDEARMEIARRVSS